MQHNCLPMLDPIVHASYHPIYQPVYHNDLLIMQNNSQLGFFFFKREDAEAIVEKVWICVLNMLSAVVY